MGLSEDLKQRALETGFDLAGVAPIDASDDLRFAREWVEAGCGGDMRYLANPKRDDPRLTLPSARSVICVGLVYNAPFPYSTECGATHGRKQKAEGRKENAESTRQKAKDSKPDADDLGSPAESSARGWISRYAWGRDYHEVMRSKLERLRDEIEALAPGVETRVFVDTGPVVERAFARRSGIGWMGKNTCLINQQKGSWFFLGVILTNLALEPDLPAPDRCGSCTRCIDACPTNALVERYQMDATRCIAYLTIELKRSIPEEFRPAMGNNVFGCDICQDVCPWNSPSHQRSVASGRHAKQRRAATTDRSEFQPLEIEIGADLQACTAVRSTDALRPEGLYQPVKLEDLSTPDARPPKLESISLFNPPLAALASIGEDDFRRVFSHSPLKRAKYRGWLRNLCVAMGNSGDPGFIPWLEWASRYEDEMVREHAQWAIDRLGGAVDHTAFRHPENMDM